MKTPTFKIFVRTDAQKVDETYPLYLQLIINRKTKRYSLNISIPEPEKYWNQGKLQIRKIPGWSANKVNKANILINKYYNRADDIILDHIFNQKPLTFSEFFRQFTGDQYDQKSFYDFATKENNYLLRILGSKETFKTNNTFISKLKKFKQELFFYEIDTDYLQRLFVYMKDELGNNDNTTYKTISYIKAICNKAIKQKIINDNPVKGFPIKRIVGNRQALTLNELKRMEALFDKDLKPGLHNVLTYFIFACYTGIRYGDITKLKHRDIVERVVDGERIKVIQIIMGKTKDPLELPLTKKALSLIPDGLTNQKLFRAFTGQVTNRHLKALVKMAKIEKNISFHCSRNTFITIGLDIGINYGIMPKLSGHKNMATFAAYYKPPVQTKLKEMMKFDEI